MYKKFLNIGVVVLVVLTIGISFLFISNVLASGQNPPTLTLSANPSTVEYGDSTTITWSTTYADNCTAFESWSGSKAVSGSQNIGNITSSGVYRLTCTGSGGSVTKDAYINIAASPKCGCYSSLVNSANAVGLPYCSVYNDNNYCRAEVAGGGWGYCNWQPMYDEYFSYCPTLGVSATPVSIFTNSTGTSTLTISSSDISGNITYSVNKPDGLTNTSVKNGFTNKSAEIEIIAGSTAGTYTVTVTASGTGTNGNSISTSKDILVTVTAAPTPTLTLTATPISLPINSTKTGNIIGVTASNISGNINLFKTLPNNISDVAIPDSIPSTSLSTSYSVTAGPNATTSGNPALVTISASAVGTDGSTVTKSIDVPVTVTAAAVPDPSGTISVAPTSCVIAIGASTCPTYVSWGTYDLIDGVTAEVTRNNPPNTHVSYAPNRSSYFHNINYGKTIFFLYHNGVELAKSEEITASCASGSTWNNTICATNTTVPTVVTSGAISVTSTSATIGGNVTSDGGSAIISRGTIIGQQQPTSDVPKTAEGGTTTGHFNQNKTNLTPETSYYYKAYAVNSVGTAYGDDVLFTTSAKLLSDLVASAPTSTTAVVGVAQTFSSTILNSGTASTGASFYNAFQIADDVSGVDPRSPESSSSMSALAVNGTGVASASHTFDTARTYSVRFCADSNTSFVGTITESNENNNCSAWTDVVVSDAPTAPTCTSPTSTNITQTSAVIGGNITSSGGSAINSRGTILSLADANIPKTAEGGTTTGVFTQSKTSLTPGTTYHYKAYATNAIGTGYCPDSTFTTLPPDSCGAGSSSTPQLTEPTGTNACTTGIYANSPADTTTAGSQAWNWSCGTVTTCSAPKYGCTTVTDTNYNATGPNNIYNCALTCANGATNYPTCSTHTITFDGNGSTGGSTASQTIPEGNSVNLRANGFTKTGYSFAGWATTSTGVVSYIDQASYSMGSGDVTLYAKWNQGDSCGTYSGITPRLTEPTTNPTACNPGTYANSPADTTTAGSQAWNWSCGTVTTCSAPKYGCTTVTDTNYNATGPNNIYNCALTCANGATNYPTCSLLPTVTTSSITNITQTTATGGGNVTSDGGATVSVSGLVWSTSSNPTTADSKTTNGWALGGPWTSNITGLTANTLYHVRAYATNSVGTSYGADVTFTTTSVAPVSPTVTTSAITNITQTTATGGGNVTSDGGATVSVSGLVWSTSSNPTTADSKTTNGWALGGPWTSNITGLTANTLYHVRAYATNSVGTSYGADVTFTTTDTSCSAPLTQNVTVACDLQNGVAASSGSVIRSQTKVYPDCTFGTPVTVNNSTYVSDNCVYPTIVNGACSSPVAHYNCLTGSLSNSSEDANSYTWNCIGSSSGSTAFCSESKNNDVILPTGTMSATACSILEDASSCNSTLSWSIDNPTGSSAITSSINDAGASAPNTEVVTGIAVTGSHSVVVPYNSRAFYLYNQGSPNALSQIIVNVDCATGTYWNDTKCVKNNITPSPTVTITATPSLIAKGKSSTLTWSSTHADSCSGANFSTDGATLGTVSVSPTVTTTYGINCVNVNAQTSDHTTVTVTVGGKQPIYKEQ